MQALNENIIFFEESYKNGSISEKFAQLLVLNNSAHSLFTEKNPFTARPPRVSEIFQMHQTVAGPAAGQAARRT